jgi:hypothetical protein
MTLTVLARRTDPALIAELEAILERAKAGHVISFAIAVECEDRAIGTQYCVGEDGEHWRLLGALSQLMHRINGKIEGM